MILLMLLIALLQVNVIQDSNAASAIQDLCPSGVSVTDYPWHEDEVFIVYVSASNIDATSLQVSQNEIREFNLGSLPPLTSIAATDRTSTGGRFMWVHTSIGSVDRIAQVVGPTFIYDLIEQRVESVSEDTNAVPGIGPGNWTSDDQFSHVTFADDGSFLQLNVMGADQLLESTRPLEFLDLDPEFVRLAAQDRLSSDAFLYGMVSPDNRLFLYLHDAHRNQTRLILADLDTQHVTYDSFAAEPPPVSLPSVEDYDNEGLHLPSWDMNGRDVILPMGDGDLYLLREDGEFVFLADVVGRAYAATLSADRRFLAYFDLQSPPPRYHSALIVIDLLTGNRLELEGRFPTMIIWSHEENLLAFREATRGVAINVLNPESCQLAEIRQPLERYSSSVLVAWLNR